MRRAVLIYNPKSGRQLARRLLAPVLRALEEGGFAVASRPTAGPADATRLAREAAAEGVEVAFAMGGDGTLREVAAGILGTDVALGPLPAGTTNVVALALGLPRQALAAARLLPRCPRRAIDVGLLGDVPFLMQASGGLDAAVMARQNGELKRRFGKAAFAWAALDSWWRDGYPEIEVRFAGRSERIGFFAACNVPFYAGAFRMAPTADLSDGLLDLVLFHGRGRRAMLSLARDLAFSRHTARPDVEAVKVEALELHGPPELRIQIDGDVPRLELPVRIAVARERLQVLAPG